MCNELDKEQHEIVSEMIELHRLAEIGKYVEMAFDEGATLKVDMGEYIGTIADNVEDLIEWGNEMNMRLNSKEDN